MGTAIPAARQVCRPAVTGTTPARPRRASARQCDEAPPCMRWRGLALPRGPGHPIARGPHASRLPPVSGSRCQHRLPGPSRDAPGCPGAEPVFSGEEFLLPTAPAAQGLSVICSRFFCRPQDIRRLSPVHGSFPLDCAQVHPQLLWMTGSPTPSRGCGACGSVVTASLLRRFAEAARRS